VNIHINKPVAIAMTIVAVAICFYLFSYSLLPYRKPPKLLTVDVSQLKPGHVISHATESLLYFVIRPVDGMPYALAVPLREELLYLPDPYWWKAGYQCRDFGLDTTEGRVTNQSVFHCRDTDLPVEWSQRLQWDSHGKHIGTTSDGEIEDMYRVDFKQSGDEITFTGLAKD
jgi:hypothetical protein